MLKAAQATGTKQRLVDAGVAAATRSGLSNISFGSLAAAAGMSKSGMFAHFGSREALLVAVIAEAERRFFDAVRADPEEKSPVRAMRGLLARFIRYSAGLLVDDGAFLSSAVHEAHALEPGARDRVRAFARRWEQAVGDAMHAAVAAGELRPQLDAPRLAFAVTGFGLATTWVAQIEGDRTLAESRGLADVDAALREVTTPAGRAALGW